MSKHMWIASVGIIHIIDNYIKKLFQTETDAVVNRSYKVSQLFSYENKHLFGAKEQTRTLQFFVLQNSKYWLTTKNDSITSYQDMWE